MYTFIHPCKGMHACMHACTHSEAPAHIETQKQMNAQAILPKKALRLALLSPVLLLVCYLLGAGPGDSNTVRLHQNSSPCGRNSIESHTQLEWRPPLTPNLTPYKLGNGQACVIRHAVQSQIETADRRPPLALPHNLLERQTEGLRPRVTYKILLHRHVDE